LPELKEDIVNILVLGIDTRTPGEFKDARSDVNIILTIDKKNKEVRLTSILRDSLIYYDKIKDYQRLNYALRLYDHPDGVVKTIEENFGIDIDHYMMADFWGVQTLIDIFGGVTVNATDAEISNLNDILWNLNELYGYKDLRTDFVEHKPGDIKLNGRQAVAYMRIRKVGADYERVQRQYEVLNALKIELSGMNFFEMNKILIKLPQLIKTDMSERELLATANTLYSIRDCEMRNARVPFDGAYKSAKYKNMWILQLDMNKTKKLLHDFVYEGKLPK
jgi:LCP family protein required for cell wall assembly